MGSQQRQSTAFLLRYHGQFDFQELDGLTAEIVSDDGKTTLQTVKSRMFDKDSNSFYATFLMLGAPVPTERYRVLLKMPSSEEPVATWIVGSL